MFRLRSQYKIMTLWDLLFFEISYVLPSNILHTPGLLYIILRILH